MSMEKISEAILEKVKAEARDIIKDAEEKAFARLEEATKQQEAKSEINKGRLLQEAEVETSRIMAGASNKARQELLEAKSQVINDIVGRTKEILSGLPSNERSPLPLIKEAISVLGIDQVRVYVSPRDMNTVQNLNRENRELAERIIEIRKIDCMGGAIVEDREGEMRIDNTYETRLEMLLPQILPEIGRELFTAP